MGEQQQQKTTWVEMGTAQLDDKGRLVIPALVRQTAFHGQQRPEVVVRISPGGHILLTPIRRRTGT